MSEPQNKAEESASEKSPTRESQVSLSQAVPAIRHTASQVNSFLLQTHRDVSDVDNFDIHILGTDMVGKDDALDEVIKHFHLRAHPSRFTPCAGYNLGKLSTFAHCRATFDRQPSKVLFVSLPGFGTEAGDRHSCSTLRHLTQLALYTLQFSDRHVVVDGATGNPAWRHPSFAELKTHPRMSDPQVYHWCAAGVQLDNKPFRRKSFVMSSMPMTNVEQWKYCCGKYFWAQCVFAKRKKTKKKNKKERVKTRVLRFLFFGNRVEDSEK